MGYRLIDAAYDLQWEWGLGPRAREHLLGELEEAYGWDNNLIVGVQRITEAQIRAKAASWKSWYIAQGYDLRR